LTITTSPPPALHIIQDFCHNFRPEDARVAPDRVHMLAQGIKRLGEAMNSRTLCIQPLYDLLVRFSPSAAHLTVVHTPFLMACLEAQHFALALPIIAHPVTDLYGELHFNDNILYHYTGGMILAAMKRWKEAEEWFEICVSAPALTPSAVQMEALKKLVCVQLIWKGKTSPPPKYTHSALSRILKSTPYNTFINSYPRQIDVLQNLLEKERQLFVNDKTYGLLAQALDRAPRWAIKRLTGTYLTLGLSEIGRAVGMGEEEVRAVILSMIETSEVDAQISALDIVTFSDPTPQFSQADVDRVLQEAQEQADILRGLEMEMSRSREYLNKAVKNKEETWGSGSMDEEAMFGGVHAAAGWVEDPMFPS